MSTLERQCQSSDSADCPPDSAQPVLESIPAREVMLGEGMAIYRAVPTRQRRLIGAWCFLDHFGPVDVASGCGMRVGPHPHIGLQTVTWLLDGEILHRDSLGSVQPIRPGQLNLMTAGRGISHSEESPVARPPGLHGAQLWIAQPAATRTGEPAFAHHPVLPSIDHDGTRVTVLLGECMGLRSPAQAATPLLGLEVRASGSARSELPLQPAFEYGVLVLSGVAEFEGHALAPHRLLYLGRGRERLRWRTDAGTCFLLLGGEPFAEPILMWWNFVARNKAELTEACRDWNAGAGHFGAVRGYDGARLIAPMPPWATSPE